MTLKSEDTEFFESLTSGRINQTSDPDIIYRLLGIIETCVSETSELKHEVQSLRDEINRLKGEQGKPNIRGKRQKPTNYSSEEERKITKNNPPKRTKFPES